MNVESPQAVILVLAVVGVFLFCLYMLWDAAWCAGYNRRIKEKLDEEEDDPDDELVTMGELKLALLEQHQKTMDAVYAIIVGKQR